MGNPKGIMVKIHYFGRDEVVLVFNVDYWVVRNNGKLSKQSREMTKRLLLDENYSREGNSPEMFLLAREDFLQRGREELCEQPGIIDVYEVVLKNYRLDRLPPCLRK